MKTKLNFIWIDDDPRRKTQKTTMENFLKVKIRFLSDMNEILNFIKGNKNKKPDCILLDHKLSNFNNDLFSEGTTFAEIIKRNFPGVPIIAVTGMASELLIFNLNIYDQTIDIGSLSDHYQEIYNITLNFKKLHNKKLWNIGSFLKLLDVPIEEKDKILSIIPELIKNNIKTPIDKSIFSFIFHWVYNKFIKHPGFLIDDLWLATLLGIKRESFIKVKNKFKKAVYNGLFASDGNIYWWQSTAKQIIYGLFPADTEVFTWNLGRKIRSVKPEDWSVCYVCKKNNPPPEIVGFTDAINNERQPMHYSCTIQHPNYQNELYFEEIRMVKPKT
jgi:CheY-like chemotaxis protein